MRHRVLTNYFAESDGVDTDKVLTGLVEALGGDREAGPGRLTAMSAGTRDTAAPAASRDAREPRESRSRRARGRDRLPHRHAPLAVLRLQPGVRRVPGVRRGRRSALRRLERLRAHRAHLHQALHRRDQHAARDPARLERVDGLRVGQGHEAACTASSSRRRSRISRRASTMRSGSSCSTTRSASTARRRHASAACTV